MIKNATISTWLQARQSGNKMAGGEILCSYINLYMPNVDGFPIKVWSLQSHTVDCPILRDCPKEELEWLSNPSLSPINISKLDSLEYYNPHTLHLGQLYSETIKSMISHGAPSSITDMLIANDGYVYYLPDLVKWTHVKGISTKDYLKWFAGALLISSII